MEACHFPRIYYIMARLWCSILPTIASYHMFIHMSIILFVKFISEMLVLHTGSSIYIFNWRYYGEFESSFVLILASSFLTPWPIREPIKMCHEWGRRIAWSMISKCDYFHSRNCHSRRQGVDTFLKRFSPQNRALQKNVLKFNRIATNYWIFRERRNIGTSTSVGLKDC